MLSKKINKLDNYIHLNDADDNVCREQHAISFCPLINPSHLPCL